MKNLTIMFFGGLLATAGVLVVQGKPGDAVYRVQTPGVLTMAQGATQLGAFVSANCDGPLAQVESIAIVACKSDKGVAQLCFNCQALAADGADAVLTKMEAEAAKPAAEAKSITIVGRVK